jgi:hypothetical protein
VRLNRAIVLLLLLGFGLDLHAAYVDPSTTSTLLQILAPVFIVLSLLGGFIKRVFLKLFRRGGKAPDDTPEPRP